MKMEFHIRGRYEPVLGPIWDNWKADDIPELAAIIPGFIFDTKLIVDELHNYGR